MNFKHILLFSMFGLVFGSCTKENFEEVYADPEKLSETSIERQFTGFLNATEEYIVPNYWNYFVNFRITLNPWTQSISTVNTPNQYIPGGAAQDATWGNYYSVMRQYRELEKVYNAADADKQERLKVLKLLADVHFYYETSIMADVFGMFPFYEAGKLSQNGGDYDNSYAAFDKAEDIYPFMLDELKKIADDLSSNGISDAGQIALEAQDIINYGDFDLWKRYTNSLRLRLLNRVSASSLSGRANSEISEILGNPDKYPIVENNDQNIMIDVFDINSSINSKGFNGGINSGGWSGDDAGKAMIDYLNESNDPRLRVLFEPGDSARGEYIGLDPLLSPSEQEDIFSTFVTAYYNRTTTSLNQFFPGVIINAAEVSLIKAEHALNSGDDTAAKEAYEMAIRQSTEFYFYVNSLSADRTSGDPDPATEEEFEAVFASEAAGWNQATTNEEKLELIGTQKWIHFNIIQPYQNWAELRRLDYPKLTFWVDVSSPVTSPPSRFAIPGSEREFNKTNYDAIKAQDQLENKVFWDVK